MSEYILIVDDQQPFLRLMQKVLQMSGYSSRTALNGLECLAIARSTDKPFLILLDYQMPYMTGFEVLKSLKEEKATQEIPVILISAEQNLDEAARQYGAVAALCKPIILDNLIREIQYVLI